MGYKMCRKIASKFTRVTQDLYGQKKKKKHTHNALRQFRGKKKERSQHNLMKNTVQKMEIERTLEKMTAAYYAKWLYLSIAVR